MTTELEPPQVPPLSPTTRARLRNHVMDRTRPTQHRTLRWLIPVLAVCSVVAVLAASVAVVGNSSEDRLPATTPTPAPVLPTQADKPVPIPIDKTVDLGPVPAKEANRIAASDCSVEPKPGGALRVLWARRVKWDPNVAPSTTVLLISGADLAGAAHRQGVAVCHVATPTGAVWDKDWTRTPTAGQGLVLLAGNPFFAEFAQSWAFFRVRPGIARIESRLVWDGRSGPWTTGVVTGGYAYTESRANDTGGRHRQPIKLQVRAFDRQGRAIPVKPDKF